MPVEAAARSRNWSLQTVRVIQAELRAIKERHGAVTPENIVAAARSPDSPLHRFFDWNDSVAAAKWRLEQARDLVQHVKVVVEKVPVVEASTARVVVAPVAEGEQASAQVIPIKRDNVREWHSVDKDGERQYVPIDEIQRDEELGAQVRAKAKAELHGWLRRYQVYKELFPEVVEEVQRSLALFPPEEEQAEL